MVIRFLVAAVATACLVPAYAAAAAPERTTHCDFRDDLVSSITTDRTPHGLVVHVTPTDEARRRGPLDYTTGSGAVTADLWHAVRSCVPGARGDAAESLHQQLECHVWFGRAASATGPTYDLESWRRPLAHPGLGSYLRTRCLNARPAVDLWFTIGRTIAGWSAAAAF